MHACARSAPPKFWNFFNRGGHESIKNNRSTHSPDRLCIDYLLVCIAPIDYLWLGLKIDSIPTAVHTHGYPPGMQCRPRSPGHPWRFRVRGYVDDHPVFGLKGHRAQTSLLAALACRHPHAFLFSHHHHRHHDRRDRHPYIVVLRSLSTSSFVGMHRLHQCCPNA